MPGPLDLWEYMLVDSVGYIPEHGVGNGRWSPTEALLRLAVTTANVGQRRIPEAARRPAFEEHLFIRGVLSLRAAGLLAVVDDGLEVVVTNVASGLRGGDRAGQPCIGAHQVQQLIADVLFWGETGAYTVTGYVAPLTADVPDAAESLHFVFDGADGVERPFRRPSERRVRR